MKLKQDNYTEEKYEDYKIKGFVFFYKNEPLIIPYKETLEFAGVIALDKKNCVLLKNFDCSILLKLSGGKK